MYLLLIPLFSYSRMEVVRPISRDTICVLQQLFSNLLSAACIPLFRVLKSILASTPEYTYSFYLLVLIHALSAALFASFDAQSLHRKEENEEEERMMKKREQTKSPGVIGTISYPKPKPRPPAKGAQKDQPWKKKYPFLIPHAH